MHQHYTSAAGLSGNDSPTNTMPSLCSCPDGVAITRKAFLPQGGGVYSRTDAKAEADIAFGNLEAGLAQLGPAVDRAALILEHMPQGQVVREGLAETLQRKADALAYIASRLRPAPWSTALQCGES